MIKTGQAQLLQITQIVRFYYIIIRIIRESAKNVSKYVMLRLSAGCKSVNGSCIQAPGKHTRW